MSDITLQNRRILLGVCGGIAAYKSAELVRLLVKKGAEVRVVMTAAAQQFVGELTFQALSANPVHTKLIDLESELGVATGEDTVTGMGHIELARWADLILVAPATADLLSRHTAGRADDLLAAVLLASRAPKLFAPAMNMEMWSNSATQQNISKLTERGVRIVGPASGEQACGDVGLGRMVEPDQIVEEVSAKFSTGALQGESLVITAGATREPLDPVRFISNRSSGKMGFAIAQAAVDAGAKVTLIAGDCALDTPDFVKRVVVESAEQMMSAVEEVIENATLFIGTAAVADYRPAKYKQHKIKKSADTMTIELVKNRDILAEVAARKNSPYSVGFAAETENLATNGEGKRRSKGVDIVAANLVGGEDSPFGSDENEVTLYWDGGEKLLKRSSKTDIARQLIEFIGLRVREQKEELEKK
ncbi:MAG: bifunctional phosphopantothenoylcysteine decarboxylase/phosphopantothenate--cysteine ligase CoaBC [Thiotrichales bacterium]|jgi:phosphopantothenoylcysteine decarboxylase / phosphopantothenate---cysteine ligase|nr:bifunctional phosphopantothenoylcysteine decarboxylase/phosphopantothenate--cysteine ligase CoaBC [Thiotrichales bacterium]MBT3614218.1 bifunctional phosphopantothenoylcysteine decarboxylase/phosphopantothenate--cysteine ligase CoaBC [Thiotrichales bacterium]MBT3752036.1 bifunctional phosphopantothenoylcysteine decarboxylase/phosphopantothenate--cysteine ligase CoaBC [Thiotrichales bacterium]MBT3837419.1 bifunctional phosphopantothenoylcysteine decarboxylase/phosphopantothenate--cysteine liga